MKTARKALVLAACAIMLVCATIAGTLAYLTATDSVSNTFTVGNVDIELTEAPVDANGQEVAGERVQTNSYKLLPGKEYDKDPTITVKDGSEDCYLFVEVENGLIGPDSTIEGGTTIAKQMEANWTQIPDTDIYYYNKGAVSANHDVVVFEHFTIAGDVDSSELAAYTDAEINVTAYAIQADGFDDAVDAWNAAGEEVTDQAQSQAAA